MNLFHSKIECVLIRRSYLRYLCIKWNIITRIIVYKINQSLKLYKINIQYKIKLFFKSLFSTILMRVSLRTLIKYDTDYRCHFRTIACDFITSSQFTYYNQDFINRLLRRSRFVL
jgi:hypothetical protein